MHNDKPKKEETALPSDNKKSPLRNMSQGSRDSLGGFHRFGIVQGIATRSASSRDCKCKYARSSANVALVNSIAIHSKASRKQSCVENASGCRASNSLPRFSVAKWRASQQIVASSYIAHAILSFKVECQSDDRYLFDLFRKI